MVKHLLVKMLTACMFLYCIVLIMLLPLISPTPHPLPSHTHHPRIFPFDAWYIMISAWLSLPLIMPYNFLIT